MKQQLGRALQDTVNKVLPTLKQGYVRPRGLAIPIDPWLRGTVRWARKLGGASSVWRPDVSMKLDQPTGRGEYGLWVTSLPDDLMIDTVLRISPTLKAKLADWNTQEFTLTLAEESDVRLETGDVIEVWGWPITVEGAQPVGSNQIIVSSTLYLGRGDQLEVPVGTGTDDWKWTTSHLANKVEFIQEDAEGYQYLLTLSTGLARAIASDEVIYMRAFPAYFSGKVSLPDFSAEYLRVIGPFLLDWMSGALATQVSYTEYFSYKQYTADLRPITPMNAGDHNAQVNNMPIKSEQLLFWRLVAGTINHQGSRAKCTCDAEGHFRLVEPLAPYMLPPTYYARGYILAAAKALLANNDWWRVHDGLTLVTFEFKLDGAYVAVPGRTTVDISGAGVVTADQVAAVMAGAIVNSALNIEAIGYGAKVELVNKTHGSLGNVPLVEGVVTPTFAVAGMSGGGGGLKWVITVEASAAATMWVQLYPNADQQFALVAGFNVVTVEIKDSDLEATHVDLRFSGAEGTYFWLTDWSLQGSRTAYVETETVVHTTTDQWASGFLFAKPLWPNFNLVQAVPDTDLMNGNCLIL